MDAKMQLTGFFVEYLIIGSISLLWLLPGARLLPENAAPKEVLVLLAPALYGVGMFIDAVSYYLTAQFDKCIREKVLAEYSIKPPTSAEPFYAIEAEILRGNPELARELRVRTSRAKVARAAITNCLLGTIALAGYSALSLKVPPPYMSVPGGVLGVVLGGCFWARWQRLTYSFALEAWTVVKQNNKDGSVLPPPSTDCLHHRPTPGPPPSSPAPSQ